AAPLFLKRRTASTPVNYKRPERVALQALRATSIPDRRIPPYHRLARVGGSYFSLGRSVGPRGDYGVGFGEPRSDASPVQQEGSVRSGPRMLGARTHCLSF